MGKVSSRAVGKAITKAVARAPVRAMSGMRPLLAKSAAGKSVKSSSFGGIASLVGKAAKFLPAVVGGGALLPAIGTIAGVASAGFGIYKGIKAIADLPGIGKLSQAELAAGGGGGAGVVKTWNTGTAQFSMLADGRIAVQKKNGVIKTFRPYRSIVLGKRIKVSQIYRASRRLVGISRALSKVLQITQPRIKRRSK